MFWPIVSVLIVIAIVVIYIVGGARKYANLFSAGHIAEFSNGMAQLKRAALASVLRPGEEYQADRYDHNTFVSSAGLGVMYTISMQKDLFCHHISLSHQNAALAHSAAMTFASWISYILNVPADKIRVPVGASSLPGEVWHVTFELSDAEQTAFKSSTPQIMEGKSVTDTLWKQLASTREEIVRSSTQMRQQQPEQ
jgi:hypothetical protein